MKFYGQLEEAAIENLSSDPSNLYRGRLWFNTTSGMVKMRGASATLKFLLNDDKIVIGTNGTAGNNIRLMRSAAGMLQIQLGDDATAEGSMSTALGKLSFKLESYTTAGRPAHGNVGRMIYDTDLNQIYRDSGAGWTSMGIPDDNSVSANKLQTDAVTTNKILNSNVTTAKIADANVTLAKLSENLRVVEFYYEDYFEVRVATTANGTLATAFANGQTVDGVVLATSDIILLKNQSTAAENGIYEVQAAGAPVRHASYSSAANLARCAVHVLLGTTNTNTTWFQTNSSIAAFADQLWNNDTNPASTGWFEWTVPASVSMIVVDACGAGGGGGGGGGRGANGASVAWSGGGGGGGQAGYSVTGKSMKVTPGTTLAIMLGKGGLGGAGTTGSTPPDGGVGGDTQIVKDDLSGDYIIVRGGNGGNNGIPGDAGDTTGAGGVGGGTETDVNYDPVYGCDPAAPGGIGGTGIAAATNNNSSSDGGRSTWVNAGNGGGGQGGGGGGGGGSSFGHGGDGGLQTAYGSAPTITGTDGENGPALAGRMGGGGGGGGGAGAGATGTAAVSGTRGGAGGCGFVRITY